MVGFLIYFINLLAQVITLLVIVKVILSYFMSPYHPIRETIDRIVNPLLDPIRRVMPSTGMIDFSPLVLLVLMQILRSVLISVLVGLS
ncbi:MAG: YggT family protein [Anaerolineales bacterium]